MITSKPTRVMVRPSWQHHSSFVLAPPTSLAGGGSRIPVSAREATMAEAGSLEVRRFHDQEGRAFRAIGWALLLSLPAWAGVIFLIFG